ncbi:MAG: hypothetical protein KBF64_04675 [Anaerolineaceae bacterium]|nr:hypothetical protein [Anaerolineaceae bacterium]
MKKIVLGLLSITLVISLFLAPSGAAQAVEWADPVVTPLSGTSDFTTRVIDPITLQYGITKTAQGLTVPSGFPTGEKQFGGKAVIIKGLETGTASLCFSFPTYRYGWRGGVYQWNGTTWSVMASTTTEGIEGSPATVCATITGDGTYALLTGFTEPPALSSLLPKCAEPFSVTLLPYPEMISESDPFALGIYGVMTYPGFPAGSRISYSIFGVTPHGAVSGALSQSGEVFMGDEDYSVVFFIDLDTLFSISSPDDFPESSILYFVDPEAPNLDFTIRVTTPTCYQDFPFSFELFQHPK